MSEHDQTDQTPPTPGQPAGTQPTGTQPVGTLPVGTQPVEVARRTKQPSSSSVNNQFVAGHSRGSITTANNTGAGKLPKGLPATSAGTSTNTLPVSSNSNGHYPQPHFGAANGIGNANGINFSEINQEQWIELLNDVGGLRGRATVALGRLLRSRGHSETILVGTRLANDIIAGHSDSFYENIITLLADGWEGTIAELLNCAENL